MNASVGNSITLYLALIAALALLFFASLAAGYVALPLRDMVSGLFGLTDGPAAVIMGEIRLPRALLALLIGASLGASGAALQGLFRNPLAEPGIVGVSASASLGAVIALYFGLSARLPFALPLAAMTGAALATLALHLLARRRAGLFTLILAGVAISYLAVALTTLAMNLSPNPFALSEIVYWLMGSIKDKSMIDVMLALPFILAGLILLASAMRGLDALTLGEETAASLGVNLEMLRLRIILGTALSVGASVAVAGSIGFVGLMAPHILRPFVAYRPGKLVLPGALGGALLLTAADIGVRLVGGTGGGELMLGVATALIGMPFFVWLVLKEQAA